MMSWAAMLNSLRVAQSVDGIRCKIWHMPCPFLDLSGQRFGRLVALSLASTGPTKWKCRCDCGAEPTVYLTTLRSGTARSCGCLQREQASERIKARFTTHGRSDTPEYAAWASLKQRCENPHNPGFKSCGGRGISVCERW